MSHQEQSLDFVTLASYPQAIIHIDCDAFFTSCEEARNPYYKGRPLATGKERGIVSCPSYAAKKQGIIRGMRLFEAKKVCPELIVLPSDYELYSVYSQRMFNILRRFTPHVEEYSIDEAYCDITGLRRMYRASYEEITRKIKETVSKELGIGVSLGISLSKILAKLCSKQNKPDGFCAIPGYKLHEFLKKIPLERVCGFGASTVALLNKYAIQNVFDYIKKPESFAKKVLGKIGVELWYELRGAYVYKVNTEKKEKYLSISKTKTFMPQTSDRDLLKAQLLRNLESACIKLRRYKLSAKGLVIFLKKNDYTTLGAQGKLNRRSGATLDFTRLCSVLFDEAFDQSFTYRATGVILTDIFETNSDNLTLFDDPVRIEKINRLTKASDEINSLYGKHTVHLAATHAVGRKQSHSRNCLTERKKELLKGETFRKRLCIPLLNLFKGKE